MSEETDLNTQIARGQHAGVELAETDTAFDRVREVLIEAIIATPITQTDKILRLHAAAQNLDAVREALKMTVANGSHAMAARDAVAASGLTRP